MRVLIAAFLLSVATPAFADNIAGCEVVLMETIEQEGLEGSAEVASFRPATDFITSIYDDETETLREIDGLPIRAIMCKRQSVVPSKSDFPIVATGTPFMISQNFDSTDSGLTTIFFKDGEFRSNYKGAKLDAETEAELQTHLDAFNLMPHDLAEKEKTMLAKAKEAKDEKPTDNNKVQDDTPSESVDEDNAPAEQTSLEESEDGKPENTKED